MQSDSHRERSKVQGIVDLNSYLKEEKQYSTIRAGEVNMSYDGGNSLQEWLTAGHTRHEWGH